MTVAAIVQARMTSTRLPGKILMDLNGRPILEHVIRGLSGAKTVDTIAVATTTLTSDDLTEELATSLGIDVIRGDEDDVLSRYITAATQLNATTIVRITADCPFTSATIVDQAVNMYTAGDYDYVSAGLKGGYPRGLDAEVASVGVLQQAAVYASREEREHVTLYVYRRPKQFKIGNLTAKTNVSPLRKIRLCVDEPADLRFLEELCDVANTPPGHLPPLDRIGSILVRNPELVAINNSVAQIEFTDNLVGDY